MPSPFRLLGISSALMGQSWESDNLLRIGRLIGLEVVLTDSSISRRHAEVVGDQGFSEQLCPTLCPRRGDPEGVVRARSQELASWAQQAG